MLSDHLKKLIEKNLDHQPTAGQDDLICKLADFILSSGSHSIFLVKGFAGTGKTTLISSLVKALEEIKRKTLLLAPTGRAAKVFASYAGKQAYTIHRKIYRQRSSSDGFAEFVLSKNLSNHLIIIVDEASMLSDSAAEDKVFGTGRLLADLISYVNDGPDCRLILIGDTAQLPPVGMDISPALDKNELNMYLPVTGNVQLKEVVRQQKKSGILENATMIRNIIDSGRNSLPLITTDTYNDIHCIGSHELQEELDRAYSNYGHDDTIVVCRSNKRANQYNSGIRKSLLFREEELSSGDLMMVVKNNYYWIKDNEKIDFIANGDIIKITRIIKYTERFGFRFAYARLHLIDFSTDFEAWILLDAILSDSATLGKEDQYKLYAGVMEDYNHITSKRKRYLQVREDPFFNALQVKYAYAITCHKAQGGQWKAVFIDPGYIKPDQIDMEYLRWLYTAFTRATEKLYLVNFPKEMTR